MWGGEVNYFRDYEAIHNLFIIHEDCLSMLTQADRIRDHINMKYFQPAKERKECRIEIRAGDVHREMGLNNAMPAVCSVLGSMKIERQCHVRKTEQRGPHSGANAIFFFEL